MLDLTDSFNKNTVETIHYHIEVKCHAWANNMVQEVEKLTNNPDHLSSIPRSYKVAREIQLSRVVPQLPHMLCDLNTHSEREEKREERSTSY